MWAKDLIFCKKWPSDIKSRDRMLKTWEKIHEIFSHEPFLKHVLERKPEAIKMTKGTSSWGLEVSIKYTVTWRTKKGESIVFNDYIVWQNIGLTHKNWGDVNSIYKKKSLKIVFNNQNLWWLNQFCYSLTTVFVKWN